MAKNERAAVAAPYLRTLANGLRILDALREQPLTLMQLAERIDAQRVSTYRILRTLEAHRMVRKDPETNRYRLTIKLWELGVASLADSEVRSVAVKHAQELLDRWGETVHVAMYDEGEVVYIHKLDGTMPLRSYTTVGGRAPAHCVSTGKALLAFQSEEEISRALDSGLVAFTEGTMTDESALRRQLARIRRTGIAVNRGEWRADIGGISSPILAEDGHPIAAIGLSGPVSRILEDWKIKAVHVRQVAATMAESLAPPHAVAAVRALYEDQMKSLPDVSLDSQHLA